MRQVILSPLFDLVPGLSVTTHILCSKAGYQTLMSTDRNVSIASSIEKVGSIKSWHRMQGQILRLVYFLWSDKCLNHKTFPTLEHIFVRQNPLFNIDAKTNFLHLRALNKLRYQKCIVLVCRKPGCRIHTNVKPFQIIPSHPTRGENKWWASSTIFSFSVVVQKYSEVDSTFIYLLTHWFALSR